MTSFYGPGADQIGLSAVKVKVYLEVESVATTRSLPTRSSYTGTRNLPTIFCLYLYLLTFICTVYGGRIRSLFDWRFLYSRIRADKYKIPLSENLPPSIFFRDTVSLNIKLKLKYFVFIFHLLYTIILQ